MPPLTHTPGHLLRTHRDHTMHNERETHPTLCTRRYAHWFWMPDGTRCADTVLVHPTEWQRDAPRWMRDSVAHRIRQSRARLRDQRRKAL